MALSRIENKWNDQEDIETNYLDLLKYRDISNEIEKTLNIEHASPQVLLVRNARCFYSASHNAINVSDILENNGSDEHPFLSKRSAALLNHSASPFFSSKLPPKNGINRSQVAN